MDAYSEDLRKKIVQALQQRRMNKSEAARSFGVSLSSVKRYAKAAREGRSLSPGKAPGKRPTPTRREGQDAPGGRRAGASFRQAQRQAGVPREGGRGLGERVDPLQGPKEDGLRPKKTRMAKLS